MQMLILNVICLSLLSLCSNNKKVKKASFEVFDAGGEKPEVVLISVFDNYMINPELETGWGFACVIEMPSEKILFDTGRDPEVLLANMEKMHIDPGSIDKVFVSHVHSDHTDGLKGFLERNHDITVFIPASFPSSIKNMISNQGASFFEISEAQKISDFVYSTGELNGFLEEQSLIIDSKRGLIVITGCAHPGIVKIVEKTEELMDQDSIYLVAGGFHQPPVSVVKKFRELGVKKVAPSHCTGDRVRNAFAEEYQDDFIALGVGRIIEVKL